MNTRNERIAFGLGLALSTACSPSVTSAPPQVATVAAAATPAPSPAPAPAPAAVLGRPKLRMGATQIIGQLEPEKIQATVRSEFGRLRSCYEDGLHRNPQLAGHITLRFTIQHDGSTTKVSNDDTDLPDAAVVGCVRGAFEAFRFPEPHAGIVFVEYPLAFSVSGPPPSTGSERVRMGALSVNGHIRPELVQRTIREQFASVRDCFLDGLTRNPELAGNVALRFIIRTDGSAANVRTEGSDLPDAAVLACVRSSYETTRFAPPDFGIPAIQLSMILSPN